jgi:hypothetical protein
VREEGRAVDRLDLLRRAVDRLQRVAHLPSGERLVARGEATLQAIGDGLARFRRALAFVPDDGQGVERLLRVPPGIGDHGDGRVVDLQRALHAGHAGDLRLVEARELAAEHRRLLDRGVQHARKLEVDTVDFLAVHLVRGVQAHDRLAGDLPVLRVLQLDALRIGRGQLRRLRRDFP